jgi:hypothetical protein
VRPSGRKHRNARQLRAVHLHAHSRRVQSATRVKPAAVSVHRLVRQRILPHMPSAPRPVDRKPYDPGRAPNVPSSRYCAAWQPRCTSMSLSTVQSDKRGFPVSHPTAAAGGRRLLLPAELRRTAPTQKPGKAAVRSGNADGRPIKRCITSGCCRLRLLPTRRNRSLQLGRRLQRRQCGLPQQ